MDITTREEAKEKGLTRYFTGKPCKRGHISERSVCNKTCIKCKHEQAKGKNYPQKSKDRTGYVAPRKTNRKQSPKGVRKKKTNFPRTEQGKEFRDKRGILDRNPNIPNELVQSIYNNLLLKRELNKQQTK